MSFVTQGFADSATEPLTELAPTFVSWHGGMEPDVQDVPPSTANVNLCEVVMAIVGQDLRDGFKYALRHRRLRLAIRGQYERIMPAHPPRQEVSWVMPILTTVSQSVVKVELPSLRIRETLARSTLRTVPNGE
jgi:hypothetical protein